jgi:hypothetical protein
MNRTLYTSLFLLALTATVATAQPAPPRITSDSLAMFTIAEDALKQGREVVRQHGFVSHVSVTPAGEVSVNIFRQHHAYLTTEKGMGLKPVLF